MFNLKNSKLGMTLIEMVISLVVLSILTTSTMGIIISSNNIFISTTTAALDRQVGGHVFETLSSILKYSTHLSIYDASNVPENNKSQSLSLGDIDSSTNSGKLYFKHKGASDSERMYEDSFYGTRTVQYSIQKTGSSGKHIKLTVRVFRDGKMRYELSRVVKCVNLALISSGDDANFIDDNSSPNSTNQFLVFSLDEMLVPGGQDAYSLEYKISQYMAKYNAIQNEYVAQLNKAYALVNNQYDATENPGIRGTTDSTTGRMAASTYIDKLNTLNKIIYGTSTSSTAKLDTNNIKECNNLRSYYQGRIEDLLTFIPTAAGFTDGNFTSRTVEGYNSNVTINSHSGDPFYGVVATKEELYAGFMLTYYDADGDGNITQEEYPKFSDPDTFFANTTISDYLGQTSSTNENEMVIMAYFKDNVASDNYKRTLMSKSTETAYLHDGQTGIAYVKDGYKTYLSNIPEDFGGEEEGYYAYDISVPEGGFCYSIYRNVLGGDPNAYKLVSGGSATSIGTYQLAPYDRLNGYLRGEFLTHYSKKGYSSPEDAFDDIKSRMSLTKLFDTDDVSKSYYQRINDNSGTFTKYTFTADKDYNEGWYYIAENNKTTTSSWGRYIVYLEASESSKANDKNVALHKGCQFVAYSQDYQMKGFYYDQAQYAEAAEGEVYEDQVEFTSVTAHQFNDYVIYATDWNSWFTKDATGLLNKILKGAESIISAILGNRTGNITSIGKDNNNYQRALGFDTQVSTENIGKAASYNMAWVVYSPKHGTWYYIPQTSTRLNTLTSNLTITSQKNHPLPLDCDLDTGLWGSSTAMTGDISRRKLSGSGLFGLVDTTSDVIWSALPVSARSN